MITLLIVDDERYDREGLKNQLDWYSFGIGEVFTAIDGFEALDIINEKKVDILVTDVKMPGMSGLELVKEVRSLKPEIKAMFVSGYDDFEFVRNAIKVNAFEYILKPVNTTELESAIGRITGEIQREQKQQEEQETLVSRLNDTRPLLRDKFLRELIYGAVKSRDIWKEVSYLKVNLKSGIHTVLLVEINDFKILKAEMAVDALKEKLDKISCILSEIQGGSFATESLPLDEARWVVILSHELTVTGESLQSELNNLAEEIIKAISEQCRITVTIGIGKAVERVEEICQSYTDSCSTTLKVTLDEKPQPNKVVEKIKKYVEENYHNEITLKDLSDKLYYSPNYLGLIFKEELGQAFSEYLTEFRMKKAVLLLKNDELKNYQVAAMVGYRNIPAFVKQFKLTYGMTPKEYKERY